MDELIRINYDSERPTVNGRDLHEALQVKTAYKDWFPRMCEYGFVEGRDFCSFLSESSGGRPAVNHRLTIDMAKQLCMIQRTDIGRKFRQYFIQVEEAWNSPEAIMARALQFANQQLALLSQQNMALTETVAIQNQQITEMKPKVSYYDVVLNCKDLISTSAIAKDYGKSAIWMNRYLHEKGVQFKQGDIWLLYQRYAREGYTSTKTHTYPGSCVASRPTIESSTKEDEIEVKTETLTITASPLSGGYVKARTSDATLETAYNSWYEKVYLPKDMLPAGGEA